MNPPFAPENNLFTFNKSALVLYVEKRYNSEINDFIQSNFNQIVEYYSAKEIDFCYLPYLLQNEKYKEIVNYNRPYLSNDVDDKKIAEIYNQIINQQTKPLQGAGLVLFETFYGNKGSVLSFQIVEDNAVIEQFHKFANAIYDIFNDDIDEIQLSESDDKPMFKIVGAKKDDDFDFGILQEQKTDYGKEKSDKKSNSNVCYSIEFNADNQFDFEAYRIADEIRTRIQQLKESDSLSLIGDILEEIQGVSKQLSKVFITNDYRIFLKDYGMKEIVMPPLPKSVFILFLRHPEGILFKQLANYHDELLSIYRNITVHENIDRAMDSIRAMTDPLNNSINEKCSRIRAAFLVVIAEELAKNYYVTGKSGQPKMITIDRSLVEFQ